MTLSIYCTFGAVDDTEPCGAPLVYRESHVLPADGDPRGGSLDLAYVPGFITRDGLNREGVRDADYDDEGVWPWLRVSVRPDQTPTLAQWRELRQHAAVVEHADPPLADAIRLAADAEDTVILTRDQVAQLRDDLTDWLLRCDDPDTWMDQYEAGKP